MMNNLATNQREARFIGSRNGALAEIGSEPVKIVFLLAVLTLVAYSSVFTAGFIWDDSEYLLNNQQLRSLDGLFRIWFEPGATPQYYPMVFTLFWVEYHLWGLDPLGYHLVNILLHSANAMLLWVCLRRIGFRGAFWAAALFALHPVHVESVAWITELKNVLSTFFYLLAFLAYWQAFGENDGQELSQLKKSLRYGAALLLFLLALFSKTVSGSLPAAILLALWWRTGRLPWRDGLRLLPFFVAALLLGRVTARLEVTHVLAKGAEWDFSFVDRLLIAGRAVWFYAGKLFWPHPLIFNYPRWQIDAGVWWQYLFPSALVLLLVPLWLLRGRIGRGPVAAVLYFVGTLFPALGFFNIYPMRFSFVADHFQYCASIGVFVLVAALLHRLRSKTGWRQAAAPVMVLVLLLLSVVTWRQGRIYHDKLTLFSDVIEKNPDSWFAYSNRAALYANTGKDALALADVEKTLALKPDEADAMHMRGVINLKYRNFERAFADFDRSIALRPWRTDYFHNRSIAYRFAGRLDEALADADRIIAMEPGNVEYYLLRASLYSMRDEQEKSLHDLNAALTIDPEDFRIYTNRGLVYFRQGKNSQAVSDYDKALHLNPGSAETHYNKGLAHAAAGAVDRARAEFDRARELGYKPDDAAVERILSR